MLDLEQPQTKQECIEHARQYAQHLISMAELKTVAHFRLSLNHDEHPLWFILWLNDQIGRVKFRIEILQGWNKSCDPRHTAEGVRDKVYLIGHMMRLSIGKARSCPVPEDSHSEWLKQLRSEWDGEENPIGY